MEKSSVILPCESGYTLRAEGSNLIVEKKKSKETYPISKIQSFKITKPSLFGGTVVFTTAQASTGGIGLGFGVSAAVGAEKTFIYKKSDYEAAQELEKYIATYEESKATASSGNVVSVVDEIRGLKQLLDEGILTEEEFAAKKKQLLGI